MLLGVWTGRWWLPGSPEHTVGGELQFADDEGLTLMVDRSLKLVDAREGQSFDQLWAPTTHPVVHGVVDDGRPVTLTSVNGNASLLPFAASAETWRPRVAFIGAALDEPEQAAFSGADVTFDNLDFWLGDPTPAVRVTQDQPGHLVEAGVDAGRAVLHEAATEWGSVSAIADVGLNVQGSSVTLTVTGHLRWSCDTPVSWNTMWVERILPLQQLAVISIGEACPITGVEVFQPDGAASVQVFFRTPDLGAPTRPRRVAGRACLLRVADLPGGFDAAVNRWYGICAAHRVAVRELFDELRAPERFVSDQLVSLVRVIGPLLDDDQKARAAEEADEKHASWLLKVGDQIGDPDIRAAVLGRLGSSRPTDRNRLAVITTGLGTLGAWLCGGDVDGFTRRVVDTRVGVAHPSSSPPKHALDGDPLIRHTVVLGWLLRCALLARLGAPVEDLLTRIQDIGVIPV